MPDFLGYLRAHERSSRVRREAEFALKSLVEHARRFPQGQLGEERDALWVQALMNAGNRHEARQRAQAFLARYPNSLMVPIAAPALAKTAGD